METDSRLGEILEGVRKEPTYLNYWNAYKRVQRLDLSCIKVPKEKRVKIAVLSSFTADPLVTYLDIQCRLAGLFPETYVAPFNQYAQEILNDESGLYSFDPEIVILAVHAESLLGEDFFPDFLKLPAEDKQKRQTYIIERLGGLASKLAAKTKALVLINNFVVPWFSPLGILDNKEDLGLKDFFHELNRKISSFQRENKQLYVVDLDGLASRHGKETCINYEMYYRGALVIGESFLPVVVGEYMGYIKAAKNIARKCIVLDLDNTLWGGILGEEGIEGIRLGGGPTGAAYVDFQRLLLAYYNRGIILALNSKNNREEALKVIREHPNMVLRERHFAAMRINWKDKVENMIELAEELNIGLDSMVFVDDLPQERERMKQALPQVLVVDLPQSPFRHSETLKRMNDFNTLVLSEEDRRRGEMYYAKRKRSDLMRSKTTLEDFLRSLDMRVEVKYADSFAVPRITSLINRTNQFNLTTRRYNQAEVEAMCTKPGRFHIYSMKVSDRFGDEGIVGVAIIEKKGQEWIVDSFLLSCRVIGRKVETAFIAKVAEDAKRQGASMLIGEYIPTEKNKPAETFYSDHGFDMIEGEGPAVRWRLNIDEAAIGMPDWVSVTNG